MKQIRVFQAPFLFIFLFSSFLNLVHSDCGLKNGFIENVLDIKEAKNSNLKTTNINNIVIKELKPHPNDDEQLLFVLDKDSIRLDKEKYRAIYIINKNKEEISDFLIRVKLIDKQSMPILIKYLSNLKSYSLLFNYDKQLLDYGDFIGKNYGLLKSKNIIIRFMKENTSTYQTMTLYELEKLVRKENKIKTRFGKKIVNVLDDLII